MNDDLKSRLAVFARLMEAEWYNGNMNEGAYDRLNADLTGLVAVYAQENPSQARSEGPGLDALREAAQNYIGWRDRRMAQWDAVAAHDHEHGMTPCPEWDAIVNEPFDIDQRLDDALRAALAAQENPT